MPIRVLVPIGLALGLAGCGAVGAIGLPLGGARGPVAPPPDFAIGAPTQPVQTADLAPLPGAEPPDPFAVGAADPNFPAMPGDPLLPGGLAPAAGGLPPLAGGQVALATPPAVGVAVGRTDLLGGWTIASGTETCQLFMTLTTWTGGYRASTPGCSSTVLATIANWNLTDGVVVLGAEGGSTVARLTPTARERFDGVLSGANTPVSVFR